MTPPPTYTADELDGILADRSAEPEALAASYLTETVKTLKEALDGARERVLHRLLGARGGRAKRE